MVVFEGSSVVSEASAERVVEGARSITVSTEPDVRDGIKVVAKSALVSIVRETELMAGVVIVRFDIFVVGVAADNGRAGLGWSLAISSMFGRTECVEVEVGV